MAFLLDASAIIAAMKNEKGAEQVFEVMDSASISAVNFTEVYEHFLALDYDAEELDKVLLSLGLQVHDYDLEQARCAAFLRKDTRKLGLSLGDRACIALGILQNLTIVTADKTWADLKIKAKIKVIR
jgi:PIN domain nuclease of toxin-antitoxin system